MPERVFLYKGSDHMKIPKYEFTGDPEDLLKFYKSLGWDPESQVIDPTKVVINHRQATEMIDGFMEAFDEPNRVSAGLFWINKGPSYSDEVPYGEVVLKDGWVAVG